MNHILLYNAITDNFNPKTAIFLLVLSIDASLGLTLAQKNFDPTNCVTDTTGHTPPRSYDTNE